MKGESLRKAKEVILDAEVIVDKPKATSAFLEWSKDPKKNPFSDKEDAS